MMLNTILTLFGYFPLLGYFPLFRYFHILTYQVPPASVFNSTKTSLVFIPQTYIHLENMCHATIKLTTVIP